MVSKHLPLSSAPLSCGSLVLAAAVFTAPSAAQFVEGCVTIHTMAGEAGADQHGWVSNSIGDVDGDEIQDMVITAPGNDGGGATAGRLYIYSGATGEELFTVTGEAGWVLGQDAGAAGDLNGDTVPDFIGGAPGGNRAIVYSGVDGAVMHTFFGEAPGDAFGHRVGGGGDFNGDGIGDVIIGAPFHDTAGGSAGRAYVYSGADWSLLLDVDGEAAGHRFGQGVAFVGDVNGDMRDDVVVGAPDAGAGAGRAYVYSFNGADTDLVHELIPETVATEFGLWFMNSAGDVDGDLIPDIYVNDFSANRAHVFSGADGSTIYTFTGDGGGGFGIGRMVADVNGDDRADLLLAAWTSGVGAGGAGKGFLYSGIDGSLLRTWTHTIAGATLGFDANGLGDVNGDGEHDFLFTAASDLGSQGRSYVVTGAKPSPIGGDVDLDCDVDVTDLLKLLNDWGPCDDPGACRSDFDGDGVVGFLDLLILISAWTT